MWSQTEIKFVSWKLKENIQPIFSQVFDKWNEAILKSSHTTSSAYTPF